MFRNYFKTALRNFAKHKFFTTLHLFGLALGMSLMLVYVAMIVFIYRFDNFHPNKEHIYRVITHVQDQDENPSFASAPIALAPLLQNNFTGIGKMVRIHQSLPSTITYAGNKVALDGYFADNAYWSMFNFPLLRGNPSSSLVNPNTMVITEAAASRIFGKKDPLGQVVLIAPYGEVMITGVAKDMPKHTHLKTEALVSFATLTAHYGPSFTNDPKNWNRFYNTYTYLQLPDNLDKGAVETYLNTIAKDHYTTSAFQASFELQGLDKIVPGPDLDNNMGNEWSYLEMLLMGIIPLVILFAACSNYVSLAISQSLRRMKEFGVRKVMGAEKKQIFIQLVLESTLIMLLAVILAYFFFEIIRSETLSVTGSIDSIDLSPSPGTFIGFIVFALLVGIFSGIVPALYFTRMGAIPALKGKEVQAKTGGRFSLRKLVIILQFMLSLGFTSAVVIMLQQQRYSLDYDLGFKQENILNVDLQLVDPQLVKNEFGKLSSVSMISMSSEPLGVGSVSEKYVKLPGNMDSIPAGSMSIDENFIANMDLQLLHGSNFSSSQLSNTSSILVNETFANKLSPRGASGAVGQVLLLPGKGAVRVTGVIKDFHYASLQTPISNFYFEYDPDDFKYANVQLLAASKEQAVAEMKAAWQLLGSDKPFEAELLSDQVSDAYSFYNNIMKLWGFLGTLAITIACLGLLGTVVFTVKNRVKEVSIRKIMGASSRKLVYLLSKDFMILLAIASIITIPAINIIMELMMREAQYYHAPVRIIDSLISLGIIVALGLTTIFSQTMKAANANPVDNLRLE